MAQTILITGASGGLGRAVAQRFRTDGATVIAGYRDPAARQALAAMGCHPVQLDVTREPDLLTASKGDIDVVINAAGVSQGGPLEELPLDQVRRQLEVNVLAALRIAQLVAPGMRRRGYGRIVNVSSVAGRVTLPGMGAYAMSKHALESMSEALRQELKPFGIAVSVIQPGASTPPSPRPSGAPSATGSRTGRTPTSPPRSSTVSAATRSPCAPSGSRG
jgi:NAD(P)-dependent dehydrogenase (short-subunit alcohol dehydrogenase family)